MSEIVIDPNRYELQDAEGNTLPIDATDYAIVIDRVAGVAIDVRAVHTGNWASCDQFARESTLAGRKWTLAPLNLLSNHVIDRTRIDPAVAPPFISRLKNARWWVWSADPYAGDDPSSPDYAWGVLLSGGGAGIFNRYHGGLALPVSPLAVPAGQ